MRIVLLFLLCLGAARAADRTTAASVVLPGGPLAFSAAVETQALTTADGKPAAEIVTTAFLLDGQAAGRPVTFAVNGGPGASSAWLDLLALGPWRVPLAIPVVPSQDPTPVDNAETWLPFTDLVFIDPPGTGFSRATGDAKPFLTVDGDVQALASVIARWLAAHHREAAPVFIAGESYGGFRGPRLARALLERQGIGVRGMVLISPVLDFATLAGGYDLVHAATRLPSIAAAHRRATGRADVADVEAYATGPYLADLLRGPSDAAAQSRIAAAVAGFTGLPEALVRRRAGRPDNETVLRHDGVVDSPYDANLPAADPFPAAPHDNSPDPLLDGLRGPVTRAMLGLYARLGWQPDGAPGRRYELLNEQVNHSWDYGRGNSRPESMTALRQYLALDPQARVLVVHGLYDLVTPYFASALLLAQVPETSPPGRLALLALPGGHMAYTGAAAREALRSAARALIAP